MRMTLAIGLLSSCGLVAACSGGKREIALHGAQTYTLQPSGKVKVYPSAAAEGAEGSAPLHRLRVKRMNQGASPSAEGCWACTDCICNGDECGCTECTSC